MIAHIRNICNNKNINYQNEGLGGMPILSVATLTVLALRASIEQVGTHLLCLLIVSFSFYLPNFVLEISFDFFRK